MSNAMEDLISADIEAYLTQHEYKSLLRFITCGSVDDGKSTLIGRLLYESKLVFEDHLAALVPGNQPSPMWSNRNCTPKGGTPICSTATTSVTD